MSVLAEAASDPDRTTAVTLFWIAVAAVAAPLVARLTRRYVPEVVVLLILGMVFGPHVLAVGDPDSVAAVSQLGLGMLFLLAGFELDPTILRGKPGAVAGGIWSLSLLISTIAVALLVAPGDFTAHVAIAIAMTSTALGTLLPIIKADGLLEQPLGRAVMAHGAVGELGPILAMSLLLTSRNIGGAAIVLALFGIAALILFALPRRAGRIPALRAALVEMEGGTFQLPVRVVVVLLAAFMAVAAVFDLDVVLGAFAAGIALRRLLPEDTRVVESLEVIGFGLLIPVFFVTSGMNIDPSAVASAPMLWVILVVGIGVARGVPVWVGERLVTHDASLRAGRERISLALYAATGLPIIVAVTQVATSSDLMSPTLASTLVAAGATTVLVFPLAARLIAREDAAAPSAAS
ncbi:cation:proton antiporter [Gordonia polyisoprenivorans]|uniref:cation:proton antiporter n=1 Tax=Gordonia polyisoprenivorans TaxID=84595 RepID=UPI001AD64258|nr:cation:proton antiporter [Gordonia polyisoprenivorans]QTI67889.1 cation:proton antiporter [Gordonia polyisoprenivorans]